MIVSKAARAHCVDHGRRDRGMRETKPLGSKTQAQAPFRPKGTFGLSVATFADSFLMAHPPAHSASGTARRSVIFTAPPLLRCTPLTSAQSTPDTGARPVQMVCVVCSPVVAVCFLPPCLPLRLRKRKTVATQRFYFAKPFGSSCSRRLGA